MPSIGEIFVDGMLTSQIFIPIIDDGAYIFRSSFIICLKLKKDARRSEIQLLRVSQIIGITLLLCLTIQMVSTFALLRIMFMKWSIIMSRVVIANCLLKRLRLTGNINSGHFDVYLAISNITENLITTSEGDLFISNNVSVTKDLISDKSKKRRRATCTDRHRSHQVKEAIKKFKAKINRVVIN